MNYTFIEINKQKLPIKFGFNALRKYSSKTNTSLQDLDKLDGAIVNRIIFGNPNHSECELHLNKSLNKRHISHGFVIPRKIFDNYLFKKASDVSNVVSGFNVKDLIYN